MDIRKFEFVAKTQFLYTIKCKNVQNCFSDQKLFSKKKLRLKT